MKTNTGVKCSKCRCNITGLLLTGKSLSDWYFQ